MHASMAVFTGIMKGFLCISILIFASSYVSAQDAHEPWEGAYTEGPFAGGEIREAYCDMVQLTETTFGGLLFAAAGTLALGFAAFGQMRQSYTAVAGGIGAFAISAAVSLYFGDLGCGESGAAGGAQARTPQKTSSGGSPYESFIDARSKAANDDSLFKEFYQDSSESHELF
jgi:hypothetical protein